MIPFGGGTSVVGGVEPRVDPDALRGRGHDRPDRLWTGCWRSTRSRCSARIQAGATGPGLEDQLRRARADPAPLPAVVSVLDPGRLDRHPGRRPLLHAGHPHRRPRRVGAGDHPGGPVGVAPAARLRRRGVARPDADRLGGDAGDHHRGLGAGARAPAASAARPACASPEFSAGAEAVRALAQSGLHPAACRLIDPSEAALTGAGDGDHALLVLGFESPESRREPWLAAALAICAEHGGRPPRRRRSDRATGSARQLAGRVSARAVPARHVRGHGGALGDLRDGDHLGAVPGLSRAVLEATSNAVRDVCGAGSVTCRLTHVYPDGPAPYYTVLGPGPPRRGARAVGGDQGGGVRGDPRRRRHDHPPPRGRPRPPAVV